MNNLLKLGHSLWMSIFAIKPSVKAGGNLYARNKIGRGENHIIAKKDPPLGEPSHNLMAYTRSGRPTVPYVKSASIFSSDIKCSK